MPGKGVELLGLYPHVDTLSPFEHAPPTGHSEGFFEGQKVRVIRAKHLGPSVHDDRQILALVKRQAGGRALQEVAGPGCGRNGGDVEASPEEERADGRDARLTAPGDRGEGDVVDALQKADELGGAERTVRHPERVAEEPSGAFDAAVEQRL